MSSRRRYGAWLAGILVWVCATAQAQDAMPAQDAPAAKPSDQEQSNALDEEARQRFQLGRTFYESGRFVEAAEQFSEAYKLSGRPQLLYNVYVANRDAAQWEPAIAALRGYLDNVPDAPETVNLRARLSSMEAQAAAAREQAERARADRERADRLGATRTVTVRSKLPWVLLGTGGALLVGSLITGVMAKGKADDLDADPRCLDGKLCETSLGSEISSLRALSVTTDVLWIAGSVSVVAGVVLRLTGALDKERQVPLAASFDQHGARVAYTVRY